MYHLACLLSGRRAARIALFMLHATPYFLIGMGAFVFPDNALGLSWLLFLVSLAKARQQGGERWLLLAGLSLGLALLAKYHAVLLLPALLYCLVVYEEWRHLLRSPYLYAGLGLALICFMPNIYWNYEHHWVSYLYQFGKSASGLELSLRHFFQGVLIQTAYLLPLNLWLFVTGVILSLRSGAKATRWLLPFAILPVGVFTLIGATRSIQPHWPMPGYLAAIVLASDWMAGWKPLNLNRALSLSGVTTLVAVVVVCFQSMTGIFPVKKKVDITLDGQGWQEVIGQLEADGLLRGETSFVFSNKWFTGGELAYAVQGRYRTTVLNQGDPHAFAFWTKMSDLEGKDGIFVTSERFPADPEKLYGDYFSEYVRLGDVITTRSGRPAQVFHRWACRKLQKAYPLAYGNN
jgi:4-amino-4-deoxy-L-arabinose transferase-like glycosyltransferase